MSEQKKVCKRCNDEKPVSEFYHTITTKDGLQSYCKVCCNEKTLEWQKKNRSTVNKWKRTYMHIPQNRIAHNGRTALRKIIKDIKPEYKFLVECGAGDRETLMNHLISTIPEGYTIADYGKILSVDHIIPCCAFDLTNREQYRRCFHYSNLRLITSKENARKGGKI
jgi:late competence protein required for DNA uptake (superfamily II DNA/RNA helicase)